MVGKKKEDLADLLQRVLKEKPELTLNKVEARSKRGGKSGVTHSYLSKILNRTARNPSADKLMAISDGFGIPPEVVFAAAGGQSPPDAEDLTKSRGGRLSLKFNDLPKNLPVDRRVRLDALIDLLEQELDQLGNNQ
jgi:transcriptional regulator with XRE-family HTH domain